MQEILSYVNGASQIIGMVLKKSENVHLDSEANRKESQPSQSRPKAAAVYAKVVLLPLVNLFPVTSKRHNFHFSPHRRHSIISSNQYCSRRSRTHGQRFKKGITFLVRRWGLEWRVVYCEGSPLRPTPALTKSRDSTTYTIASTLTSCQRSRGRMGSGRLL